MVARVTTSTTMYSHILVSLPTGTLKSSPGMHQSGAKRLYCGGCFLLAYVLFSIVVYTVPIKFVSYFIAFASHTFPFFTCLRKAKNELGRCCSVCAHVCVCFVCVCVCFLCVCKHTPMCASEAHFTHYKPLIKTMQGSVLHIL